MSSSAIAVKAPFERSVFVNCPFDDDYLPLLHAMVFAIHDCGFIARLSVEDTGGSEMRVEKIVRLIRESRLSIHDVSRVELSKKSKLPRFNMPFECGLALGCIRYESKPLGRDFLLMTAVQYQDQKALSDLAGQDAMSHNNEPAKVIAAVRNFLSAKKSPGAHMRGEAAIADRYARFRAAVASLAPTLGISATEIVRFDYLRDWMSATTWWLATKA